MAPTRPSIMSEGAMMSQPASRLHQRLLDQHGDRLVVEDDAVAQQAVMAVAGEGIERDVGQEADLRHFLFDGAQGAADQIVRVERLAAGLVAQGSDRYRGTAPGTGWSAWPRVRPRAPPGRPKAARRRASRGPAARLLSPSMTNSGQIRSSVVSWFSRTMRRAHSLRRLRRGRVGRSRRSLAASFSTGARWVRASIGRPNLIAIEGLRGLFLAGPGTARYPPRVDQP